MNALELKVPPAALVLALGIAMWFASAYAPPLAFSLPWRVGVAITLGLFGMFIILAGVLAFHKADTTVNPVKPGSASALVTSDIYRLSRNPMYVGFLLMLAGWAAYLSHVLAFVFLPIFVAYMNRFQIEPEERALAALFGEQFEAYKARVRRWL